MMVPMKKIAVSVFWVCGTWEGVRAYVLMDEGWFSLCIVWCLGALSQNQATRAQGHI